MLFVTGGLHRAYINYRQAQLLRGFVVDASVRRTRVNQRDPGLALNCLALSQKRLCSVLLDGDGHL